MDILPTQLVLNNPQQLVHIQGPQQVPHRVCWQLIQVDDILQVVDGGLWGYLHDLSEVVRESSILEYLPTTLKHPLYGLPLCVLP